MDYNLLLKKKQQLKLQKENIPKEILKKYDKNFDIDYTHNSTAIEGNTLTLIETKAIIEDQLSVGGKSLREIYEVVNHNKAFKYVKKCISLDKALEESIVKDIHMYLMESILDGGIYRNVEVRITGAKHKPPAPSEMYRQIKEFFADILRKQDMNSIELAAWTHAEFVKIHPFTDGNGRTSRLIMNYQLMQNGFLPISIQKENRLQYFEVLESYAVNGDLIPFIEMIAELEMKQLDEYLSINQEQKDGLQMDI